MNLPINPRLLLQLSKPLYVILGVSFAFPILWNRITVALLLIASIHFYLQSKNTTFTRDARQYVLPALFLIFFLVYLITDLFASPSNPAQVVDTYFLFPVFAVIGILIYTSDSQGTSANSFLNGFLIGNVAGSIMNLGRALFFSLRFEENGLRFDSSVWGNTPVGVSIVNYGNYFFSEYFSWFLHPTYAAIYLELCLAYVLYLAFSHRLRTRYAVGLSLFFLVNLFLLSSRIAVACVLLISVITVIYWGGQRRAVWVVLIAGVLAAAGGLLHPKARQTLSSSFRNSERFHTWQAAAAAITGEWASGVGITNNRPVLYQQYRRMGFESNAEKYLNAHNQYLETLLASGIPGVIGLVALFGCFAWRVWERGEFIAVAFAGCFFIHVLVESVLARHQGILLFLAVATIVVHPRRNATHNG